MAHSANKKTGKWQTMREHTEEVSQGAWERAPRFLRSDAYLAGLFHDFGKYSAIFRKRLDGEASGLDHWTPGAYAVLKNGLSEIAALVIHGHHVGLTAFSQLAILKEQYQSLERRTLTLELSDMKAAATAMHGDGLRVPSQPARTKLAKNVAGMLDVRFVTSAVVDADHSDTALHFSGVPRSSNRALNVEKALKSLQTTIRKKQKGQMASAVGDLRASLRKAAMEAAEGPRGLYALEAPTGAGKTLSMLEFALRHMKRHTGEEGLRRIIVVLPFLSLLDETVKEIRGALGKEAVDLFEHHSVAPWSDASGEENMRGRERAEDWTAPIVVTTSVQFLQTLFADQTVPLRKLHSVANSVILMDEVQSVPRPLSLATMRALARLASPEYGCTVVLSTATQPEWEAHAHRFGEGESPFQPRSIAPRSLGLFGKIDRFSVDWSRTERGVNWDALAREMIAERRVLAIVNLKAHARELTEAIQNAGWEGPLLHLSTNLCPAHRKKMLERPEVAAGDCLFVATQCVEAGVNLDFPTVYRAVAPLESIVQAAGRCNRHGNGRGEVRVFMPAEERYPGKMYEAAAKEALKWLEINDGELDLRDPVIFAGYYARLDSLSDSPMTKQKLEEAIRTADFPKVAELYRLIDEQDVVHVAVPYEGAPDVPAVLTAEWFRKAQRFSVSASRKAVQGSLWCRPISDDRRWWQVTDPTGYDPELLGLKLDAELPIL